MEEHITLLDKLDDLWGRGDLWNPPMLKHYFYDASTYMNDAFIYFTDLTDEFLTKNPDLSDINTNNIKHVDKALLKLLVIFKKFMDHYKVGDLALNQYLNNILESRGYNRNKEPYEMNLYLLAQMQLAPEFNKSTYKYYYKDRTINISADYLQNFVSRLGVVSFHLSQSIKAHDLREWYKAQQNIVEGFIQVYICITQIGNTTENLLNTYDKTKLFK